MGVHNLAQVEIIQDDDGMQMKVEKRKTKNEKIINIKQKMFLQIILYLITPLN